MPSVSVLVTVYNRENFLAETLNSIVGSTYRDFEVIVVDDCSSDRSLAIARDFAAQDDRVHVYANETNLGDYKNRNRAASLAKGEYLKYLDADDLIYPHGLSTMVDAMKQFPEAGLALSSNIIDPEKPYPILIHPYELYFSHYLGRSPLGVGPSASIIRRDCFNEIGGFSGAQFIGDTELWLRLCESWPVVALPPSLVWWRRHPDQQIQLERLRPEVLNIRHALESEMLRKTSWFSGDQKQRALASLNHLHARRLLSLAFKGRKFTSAWSLFRSSGLTFGELLKGFKKPNNNYQKELPGSNGSLNNDQRFP